MHPQELHYTQICIEMMDFPVWTSLFYDNNLIENKNNSTASLSPSSSHQRKATCQLEDQMIDFDLYNIMKERKQIYVLAW